MVENDLNTLTMAELKLLQKAVGKAIDSFEARKKLDARTALQAHAKGMGFTLEELVGQSVARTRAKAAQKYRNPENAAETWSGRGRTPRWYSNALAAGKTEESLGV